MPIKIQSDYANHDFRCTKVVSGGFELTCPPPENLKAFVNCPLEFDLSKTLDFDKYILVFFSKKDVKENEILQIKIKNRSEHKRIGWLFPIQALSSNEHDYANDVHFLNYARIGGFKALNEIDFKSHFNLMPVNDDNVGFNDIFHDSTCLLIINKDDAKDFDSDILNAILPELFCYGFVKLGKSDPDGIKIPNIKSASKELKLKPVSSQLQGCGLVGDLLSRMIAFEDKSISKFFFCYQIVELLIDNIYRIEQENIIESLIESREDSGKAKESIDKLQDCMREKKRLTLLIEKYTDVKRDLHSLKSNCNDLLEMLGKSEGNNFQDYFYMIRNFTFHQYRDFPEEGSYLLNDIADDFLAIMPDLLSSFKNPRLE